MNEETVMMTLDAMPSWHVMMPSDSGSLVSIAATHAEGLGDRSVFVLQSVAACRRACCAARRSYSQA